MYTSTRNVFTKFNPHYLQQKPLTVNPFLQELLEKAVLLACCELRHLACGDGEIHLRNVLSMSVLLIACQESTVDDIMVEWSIQHRQCAKHT